MQNIFIVGVQKCYTTYYHNVIATSESVVTSKRKELHFFDHYPNRNYKGVNFDTLFPASKARYRIDSTPSYSIVPGSLDRIFDYDPDAKIIHIVRDRVLRSWSQYWHDYRNGFVSDTYKASLLSSKNRYESCDYTNYFDYVCGNYYGKSLYELQRKEIIDRFQNTLFLDCETSRDINIKLIESFLDLEIKLNSVLEKNSSVLPLSPFLARVGGGLERKGQHKLFVLLKKLNKSNILVPKISVEEYDWASRVLST